VKRLAILVSGNGTNMENLLQWIKNGELPAEAALVVSDNPEAYALERARRFGIEPVVVDRKKYESREAFEADVRRHIELKKIDYIVLAGFMRVLSPGFVNTFPERILNIHPSFLPDFPGAHAIRDAFENKTKLLGSGTGVTVHLVTEKVDAGPPILQERVPIKEEDTLDTLEQRIHQVEYRLYPEAIKLLLEGKIKPQKKIP
jgi:phosphoribosylglycinamide formyltransferase-1